MAWSVVAINHKLDPAVKLTHNGKSVSVGKVRSNHSINSRWDSPEVCSLGWVDSINRLARLRRRRSLISSSKVSSSSLDLIQISGFIFSQIHSQQLEDQLNVGPILQVNSEILKDLLANPRQRIMFHENRIIRSGNQRQKRL